MVLESCWDVSMSQCSIGQCKECASVLMLGVSLGLGCIRIVLGLCLYYLGIGLE